MLGLKPSFVGLKSCKPKDLIRISLDGSVRWALCGQQSNGFFALIVLDVPTGPIMMNVGGPFVIDDKYENLTILNYGANYDFEIVQGSLCQLEEGAPLFSVIGAAVVVESEFGFCVRFVNSDQTAYFFPATAAHTKDPAGRKAAFAHWRLLMLKKEPPHELIFESNVQSGVTFQ
jgi:hypothetical protein